MLTSHSRSHGTPPKEPWEFSPGFLADYRRAAEMKYRLMPYIYAQAKDASERGLPMMRALFVEYPDDPGSWLVEDEYLLGSDLLVAPLLETGMTGRAVYLPPGKWIDYQTAKAYAGGWHQIAAGALPVVVLVRDGAVHPAREARAVDVADRLVRARPRRLRRRRHRSAGPRHPAHGQRPAPPDPRAQGRVFRADRGSARGEGGLDGAASVGHGRSRLSVPDLSLSSDQVHFFEENGYVKGGRVLDDARIQDLREGLEAIRSGENPRISELYEVDEDYRRQPDKNVFHFLGAWLIDTAFHDVLFHARHHGEGGAAPRGRSIHASGTTRCSTSRPGTPES